MAMIEGPGIPVGAPQAAPQAAQAGNGLAVGALVLSILALFVFWLPVVGPLAGLLFGVTALVLSILGKKKASLGASGGGMAIAGLVLSILALLASAAAGACQVACFTATNKVVEESKKAGGTSPFDAFRKQLEKAAEEGRREAQKGGAAPADAPDEAPEEEPAPAK